MLLGSVFSTLFAGLLADWMGRKPLMVLSGVTFIVSIPVIALSQGYGPLFFGRLLQGISGGFIGVVVPLYLAECLSASTRGKGTGIFQWLLTLGIVVAALIGIYYSYRVEAVARPATPPRSSPSKIRHGAASSGFRCRRACSSSLAAFLVAESPRWLFRRGNAERRLRRAAALPHLRTGHNRTARDGRDRPRAFVAGHRCRARSRDSLLRRKYVIPFLLACVILFCNTATGINSVIGYNTNILLQSGLSDLQAHWGYVVFTFVNFFMTMCGMMLVDRKGRKFLLILGTSGIIISMLAVGCHVPAYRKAQRRCRDAVQAMASVRTRRSRFASTRLKPHRLLAAQGNADHAIRPDRASLAVIYSYGDFTAATNYRALRRSRSGPAHHHPRKLRACQQSRGLLQKSLRQSRCRANCAA